MSATKLRVAPFVPLGPHEKFWRLEMTDKPWRLPDSPRTAAVLDLPAVDIPELPDLGTSSFAPPPPPPPLQSIKGAPVIEGLAIRWGEPTTIDSREGSFVESFERGAFSRSLARPQAKLSALYQHGLDPALGMRSLGPVQAWETDRGLEFQIATLPTEYAQDIVEGVLANCYGGSSIRFSPVRQRIQRAPGRSAENPRGLERRVIHQANLREISVVNWPAYSSTTVKA